MKAKMVFSFIVCLACSSLATEPQSQQRTFLTIQESVPTRMSFSQTPQEWISQGLRALETARLNLLEWVQHRSTLGFDYEAYNRQKHFGSWVDDPTDQTCLNTRAQVLLRDSKEPVTYRETNSCAIEKGLWKDPYSGNVFTNAEDIQIDHMIPLKNAYISGAWKWDDSKRCLFANFTNNRFHLLSVSGHENMSKSDRTPAEYLPSNRRHVCTYLKNWLKIKLIWALEMTREEGAAIRSAVTDFGCDPETFQFRHTDLVKQRVAAEEMQIICSKSSATSPVHLASESNRVEK